MDSSKILVVDDEPDVVQMMQRILESEGFEVLCAYDGISAVDIAENERPDLILLDLMMPMMSGYEVCRQLRTSTVTKEIPILCVTSAHAADSRQQAQAAGAQALLVKPFFSKELVAQVNRYLSPNGPERTPES